MSASRTWIAPDLLRHGSAPAGYQVIPAFHSPAEPLHQRAAAPGTR